MYVPLQFNMLQHTSTHAMFFTCVRHICRYASTLSYIEALLSHNDEQTEETTWDLGRMGGANLR